MLSVFSIDISLLLFLLQQLKRQALLKCLDG